MTIIVLDIIEKQFTTKFCGYNEQEDDFLDIIVDGYEDLVH